MTDRGIPQIIRFVNSACRVDHNVDQPERADLNPWLVVRTKPRHERIAQLHLEQRGMDAYCPMFLERSWGGRRRRPVPLFAGYIFVDEASDQGANAIHFCPGVLCLLTFDRRRAVVGAEVIEALREREQERGFILPMEEDTGIPLGRRVRVMEGPLKGMEGAFHGYLRGGERARILLEFMRAEKLVEVESGALSLAQT